MKRLIIITGIIVSSFLSSCSDFVDDYFDTPAPSSLDEALIFSNADLAKGAVDGIKIPLGEDQSYRNRYLLYYGLNSDTEWYNSSQSSGAKSDLCVYDTKSNNGEMNTAKNVWGHMYAGIERANICIRGLRTYGNPTPGSELGYLLGEAITLRAFYYADLLKTWGDVPARFEPINSENLYLPRTNRDIIYKQLIADLGEAEELVPWPNDSEATKTTERVNKAFVKGLRARLAMVASGYQQYPDGGKGTVRRSTDPELSVDKMYTLALKECRDVIGSGKASLIPSFETLWKSYNEEALTAGRESLWEIPFQAGRGQILKTFAVVHNGNDQFVSDQGKKVGGTAGPLPNVFYDYNELDTRRDITCVPYYYGSAVNGIAKQDMATAKLNTWYFGKYRYEWMKRVVTSDDCGMNKIYMRYAEVLLMAAEAANELEGPTAAAPYLKEIRNRAFLPANRAVYVEDYVNSKTTKELMFNAIVDEHKYEFTGEMERKMALIRWGILKKKLDEAKDKMLDLQNRAGDYATVPTKLYTKYKDAVNLEGIYGLNRGETGTPPVGYNTTAISWTWTGSDAETKRTSLYKKDTDPNTRQFWPIWDTFINGSNGMLINDYGY